MNQQSSGIQLNGVFNSFGAEILPESWANSFEDLPLIASVQPLQMGVHRAATIDGESLTPYVARDLDRGFRDLLVRGTGRGGIAVLVVGDSTSGKSRTAYEGLQAQLPHWRIAIPSNSRELRRALVIGSTSTEKIVLWLDDFEFFAGPDGLTAGLLSAGLRSGLVVVGTIRTQQYNLLRNTRAGLPKATEERHHAHAEAERLLELFEEVRLERRWTSSEIERAGKEVDERISDALRHANDYGVAEYLAAGPDLLRAWELAKSAEGSPRAAALISAAIDLHRVGVRDPISLATLTECHGPYLDRYGGALLRPESMEVAIEWATERRYGVTSLLVPTDTPGHIRPFDYLVDQVGRTADEHPIPDEVWAKVSQMATEQPSLLARFARAAYASGKFDIARGTLQQAAAATGVGAFEYSLLLRALDDVLEADKWLRTAAERGHLDAMVDLGIADEDARNFVAAEEWFQNAAQQGNAHAAFHLATLLRQQDRNIEAEPWARQAVAGEESGALENLASILGQLGQADEAEALLQGMVGESPDAANAMGIVMEQSGRRDDAIGWWKKALEAGNMNAAANLGLLYLRAGELSEAERVTRLAIESMPAARAQLGAILLEQEKLGAAETELVEAAGEGDVNAASVLGAVYAAMGEPEKAERWFEFSVSVSPEEWHLLAYGGFLYDSERYDDAFAIYSDAADLGSQEGAARLGSTQRLRGNSTEAVTILKELVSADGEPQVKCELGMAYADLEDFDSAVAWLEESLAGGHGHAGCTLGNIYEHQHQHDDAIRVWTKGYDLGHEHLSQELIKLLRSLGQGSEAASWQRRASGVNSKKKGGRRRSKTHRRRKK